MERGSGESDMVDTPETCWALGGGWAQTPACAGRYADAEERSPSLLPCCAERLGWTAAREPIPPPEEKGTTLTTPCKRYVVTMGRSGDASRVHENEDSGAETAALRMPEWVVERKERITSETSGLASSFERRASGVELRAYVALPTSPTSVRPLRWRSSFCRLPCLARFSEEFSRLPLPPLAPSQHLSSPRNDHPLH